MYIDKPIIFIGMPRAGTTIISEIIFQHEDLALVANYHEKYPNFPAVNLIRLLFDNRLWYIGWQKKQLNKVPYYNKYVFKASEAYDFWNNITSDEIGFSKGFLLDKKIKREEEERIRKVFRKMIKYQGKKRLAFKITGPGRVGFLNSIFPDAVFVEVTREPYANIRSLLKVPFWKTRGMKQLWWTGAYIDEEKELAEKWKDKPALITALQYKKIRETTKMEFEKLNIPYLTVAYEDFIQFPEEMIKKILIKVGLKKSTRIDRCLKDNEIYNRNVDSRGYYSEEDLIKMESILRDYIN